MRAREQKESLSVLLVEEHPFRNRLYRGYITALGCVVLPFGERALADAREAYSLVVLSIPEDISTHARYRALLDTLPASVPCIALSVGALPELFSNCAKLVRHFNRSDTNPGELVDALRFVVGQRA